MNKQCKACGTAVPNEAKFCPVCGGSEFLTNTPQQPIGVNTDVTANQPVYNQTQYAQPNPVSQGWQPPVVQTQPKKKKTGLIIGIVAAVLVVLAAIGMLAEKVFQDQGYGDSNDDDYSYIGGSNDSTDNDVEETPEKYYYSKGTFDGSVYQNKWADIQFALPVGFSDADLATYSAAENSDTECGMYFMADDSMGLIYICYEKLPAFPVYDEEDYLDAAMKSLQNVSGVTYTIPSTYFTANIGGYAYTKAVCEFNNGYGDFVNTFYVRKLDNYMIVISTIGVNSAYNDGLVSTITTAR